MPGSSKVNGVWKTATGLSVKVGGQWKTATSAFIKVGGQWKQWFASKIQDAFNRASTVSGLGTADSGQIWNALRGNWRISGSNTALSDDSASSYPIASVNFGNTDVKIQTDTTGGVGVAFWVSDSGSWWAAVPRYYTSTYQYQVCNTGQQSCTGAGCTPSPNCCSGVSQSSSSSCDNTPATCNGSGCTPSGCCGGVSYSGGACDQGYQTGRANTTGCCGGITSQGGGTTNVCDQNFETGRSNTNGCCGGIGYHPASTTYVCNAGNTGQVANNPPAANCCSGITTHPGSTSCTGGQITCPGGNCAGQGCCSQPFSLGSTIECYDYQTGLNTTNLCNSSCGQPTSSTGPGGCSYNGYFTCTGAGCSPSPNCCPETIGENTNNQTTYYSDGSPGGYCETFSQCSGTVHPYSLGDCQTASAVYSSCFGSNQFVATTGCLSGQARCNTYLTPNPVSCSCTTAGTVTRYCFTSPTPGATTYSCYTGASIVEGTGCYTQNVTSPTTWSCYTSTTPVTIPESWSCYTSTRLVNVPVTYSCYTSNSPIVGTCFTGSTTTITRSCFTSNTTYTGTDYNTELAVLSSVSGVVVTASTTTLNTNSGGYSTVGSVYVSTAGNAISVTAYSGSNLGGTNMGTLTHTPSSPTKGTSVGIIKAPSGNQGSTTDNFLATI